MSWNDHWLGQWQGDWLGSLGEADGSIHGWSAQSLGGVAGASAGELYILGGSAVALDAIGGTATGYGPAASVTGASDAQLDATYGDSAGALAIVGESNVTLGDATAAAVEQYVVVSSGVLRDRSRPKPRSKRAIVGRSICALDDVIGVARGTVSNVTTRRQRLGRRDDEALMVSGWR